MKKALLFLTVFNLLVTLAPSAWAYDGSVTVTSGQTIYYNYNSSNQTIEITYPGNNMMETWSEYTAPIGALVIPDSITHNGVNRPVVAIRNYAFKGCSGLTAISIGNNIASIGEYAFQYCSGLTTVTIGNSVTSIGGYAFWFCSGLTSVIFYADSCLSAGGDVFYGCNNLINATFGNNVKHIPGRLFEGCGGLTSVSIGSGVTSIGSGAFFGCTNLDEISYEGSIAQWCNISFGNSFSNPIYYAHTLSINGSHVTNLVIPNSVASIGDYAFFGCTGLTSMTIPNSVTEIGSAAFNGCSGLKDVYCFMDNVPRTATNAFLQTDVKNTILHVKDYALESFMSVEPWSYFKEIVCDEIVTDFNLTYYVDNEIYRQYKHKYKDVITPEPYPEKEGFTFSGWSGMPKTMPARNANVYGTFSVNKYKLTFLVDDVEYASYQIDYGSATRIPESKPQKENFEFISWSEIPETMPARNITSTASFKKVSTDIDGIKYKYVGDEAYVIGNNKSGVVKVLSSFEEDGKTYTVTVIDKSAFKNNTNITAVEVPNTIKAINDSAFFGCKNLTIINLGNSVRVVGERAFAIIDKLTDVVCYADKVPDTDRTAFENSYIDYVTLHVPAASVEKYKATGPWKGFKEIVPIDDPTKIVSIHSVDKQKASYNLNGIKISKANKTAKGIIIRDGKKYFVR